jgi:AGZA family xanthine/uracil permease-like MFS transporter
MPRFDTVFQADLQSAFKLSLVPLLLSIIMVDFFDTMGTVTAIAETGNLHDREGRIPRLRAILAIDSVSAVVGGTFGVSSVTSYIESAAGVAEGARTGLHNVVVAALFGACIFAAPLVAIVPSAASAPALIVVGFLMCQQIVRMDFGALDTAIPAFLILLMTPLTFSISHGIGYGFISYVAIKLLRGRARDVQPMMYAAAALFVAYFWLG